MLKEFEFFGFSFWCKHLQEFEDHLNDLYISERLPDVAKALFCLKQTQQYRHNANGLITGLNGHPLPSQGRFKYDNGWRLLANKSLDQQLWNLMMSSARLP